MVPGRCAWGKRQRLLRASDFAPFSNPQGLWRASRRWIAMSAHLVSSPDGFAPDSAPRVRFGFTVSRRQERRAVARNAVRRVLREAARRGAWRLAEALPAPWQRLDILLRLKAPLPEAAEAGWGAVKSELRREAEGLIDQLRDQLREQRELRPRGARTPG